MLTRLSMADLYLINSALLFTHEIDSAFWREWDLFGLPGGIQGFLLANFLLLVIALYGFKQVLLGTRGGKAFSLVLATAGVFAFCIHSYFIASGHAEFTLPGSLLLLVLILVVSVAQGVVAVAK